MSPQRVVEYLSSKYQVISPPKKGLQTLLYVPREAKLPLVENQQSKKEIILLDGTIHPVPRKY
jgi:hypothetical protein